MSPTKQEIAEGLTVEELRQLAAENDIDLTGLSVKADIVDAVTAGLAKSDLEAAADDETTADETTADESSRTGTVAAGAPAGQDPIDLDVPLADEELPALGPPNPEPVAAEARAVDVDLASITSDTEAQQKAGVSPADLEVPGLGPGGPAIIVKQNPETPSINQIQGALAAVPGPAVPEVTVRDSQGEEVQHNLGADDMALISSRANATTYTHPAHATPGHWSNPLLTDMTDEEKEADQKAYAERFGK